MHCPEASMVRGVLDSRPSFQNCYLLCRERELLREKSFMELVLLESRHWLFRISVIIPKQVEEVGSRKKQGCAGRLCTCELHVIAFKYKINRNIVEYTINM